MPIQERKITPPVANALNFIGKVLADPECPNPISFNKAALAQEFGLNPQELALVVATLGLTFEMFSDGGVLTDKDRRRLIQQAFIDNPAGSRQTREEKWGKDHIPKRRSPTGRNHSRKQKAIKF